MILLLNKFYSLTSSRISTLAPSNVPINTTHGKFHVVGSTGLHSRNTAESFEGNIIKFIDYRKGFHQNERTYEFSQESNT